MRRSEREVRDFSAMCKILEGCDVLRLGFSEEGGAYIVPVNFGLFCRDGRLSLYFHGASEGKKAELIKESGAVGFEADRKHELVRGETACAYSYRYQSVIGKGRVESISDTEEKKKGLLCIMKHYAPEHGDFSFPDAALSRTAVFRIDVTEWSAKEHGMRQTKPRITMRIRKRRACLSNRVGEPHTTICRGRNIESEPIRSGG